MSEFASSWRQTLDRAASEFKAGNLSEAERLLEQVVAEKSDLPEAVFHLAVTQSRLGKTEAALKNFDRALALRADFATAHYNRGAILQELKRYEEALASYDRALALQPDFAMALSNRGNVLQELRRFGEALASFDRALALNPDFAVALYNRGNVLCDLERYDEALANYERALALRPNFAVAFASRGTALQKLKRHAEAVASFDRAIALQPDLVEAHTDRGNAFHATGRFEEALANYDRAINIQPGHAAAHYNRGLTLHELGRCEEAVASYGRAIELQPDLADAHLNQSLSRLLTGDFERGWPGYEWRMDVASRASTKRSFPQPQWFGREDISGKTILLHAEQGFGDTIQFCRYVPLVAARGADIILEVPAPLAELMTTLAGNAKIVPNGGPLPDIDMHCPLLSLPLAFGTQLKTIPATVPYLRASSEGVNKWETRLGPKQRPRIGLAWSGRPTYVNDRNRSIPLSALLPLLDIDATFISLQKDVRDSDAPLLRGRGDLRHFGDELKDFAETAALVSQLDLVISIDSSVAHLVGALAKPVWVLLPFIPDWRWLLNRDDSPWYPTARLFRQDASRTWDSVIARARSALREFLQGRS
jgi:tetratricopeptide (TPR) repeat protein